MDDARVRTAGWSYRDWVGPVYPEGLPGVEQLSFYAQRLATVEVNSTFYRTPARRVVDGWVERTRDEPAFEFTLKAPKKLTQDALAKAPPAGCARLAREWREAVVEPIAEAGKTGALLLQLSPGVLHNRDSIERLDAALGPLHDFAIAVEPRNRTWLDPGGGGLREDALQLLDAHDAALVMVDGPSTPCWSKGTRRTHTCASTGATPTCGSAATRSTATRRTRA